MSIQVNGVRVARVFNGGVEYESAYVNGVPVFLPGGVPVIRSFALNHPRLVIGTTVDRLSLSVAASGATSGTLTETLADGTRRVIATQGVSGVDFNSEEGQSLSFVEERPSQSAHYALSLSNANGTVVAFADFEYGRAPTIAYFRNAGFRQGIAGVTPHQVLLEWNVTGAVPDATVTVTTTNPGGWHYRNMPQSGSYAYSRQGGYVTETLVLTASNDFGTVRQSLTITWPR